jgi:hypothetical protein
MNGHEPDLTNLLPVNRIDVAADVSPLIIPLGGV